MDFSLAVAQIIKEQEKIIGPLAIELASGVDGLSLVDLESKQIVLVRDGKLVIHDLVHTYSQFFGRTSIEICRDIIKRTCPTVTSEDMQIMTNDALN